MDEHVLFKILGYYPHKLENIVLFKDASYREKINLNVREKTAQRLNKLIMSTFSHCYFWDYLYFPPDRIQIESIFNAIDQIEGPGFYNMDDLMSMVTTFDDYLTGFKIKKRKPFLFEQYPNINANIIF